MTIEQVSSSTEVAVTNHIGVGAVNIRASDANTCSFDPVLGIASWAVTTAHEAMRCVARYQVSVTTPNCATDDVLWTRMLAASFTSSTT